MIGIRNPSSIDKESKKLSSTWNPESMAWNLESKTVLDSFTWGEQETEKEFLVMHSKIHSVCYMNT